jgi:hypothetical protein
MLFCTCASDKYFPPVLSASCGVRGVKLSGLASRKRSFPLQLYVRDLRSGATLTNNKGSPNQWSVQKRAESDGDFL